MSGAVRNLVKFQASLPALVVKRWCSHAAETLTVGERKITQVLKEKFPSATQTHVHDISGGCGSMFEIYVESDDFKGKRVVMQHRMVTEALKEEIKDMHGLKIATAVPGNS